MRQTPTAKGVTKRTVVGALIAGAAPMLLTLVFAYLRDIVDAPFHYYLLPYLLALMFIALYGPVPAIIGIVTGTILADYYVIPPLGSVDLDANTLGFAIIAVIASSLVIALSTKRAAAPQDETEQTPSPDALDGQIGEPVTAQLTLALGESGQVYGVFPSGDDPRLTTALAARGRQLFTCSGECVGCAICR